MEKAVAWSYLVCSGSIHASLALALNIFKCLRLRAVAGDFLGFCSPPFRVQCNGLKGCKEQPASVLMHFVCQAEVQATLHHLMMIFWGRSKVFPGHFLVIMGEMKQLG